MKQKRPTEAHRRIALERVEDYLYGDLKSTKAPARIKALAIAIVNLSLPDRGKGFKPGRRLDWNKRIRKAAIERDEDFFADLLRAIRDIKGTKRRRKKAGSEPLRYPANEIKHNMAEVAYEMLTSRYEVATCAEIIQETKYKCVRDELGKRAAAENTPEDPWRHAKLLRADEHHQWRKAAVTKIKKEFARRVEGGKGSRIQWGKIAGELGLTVLGPAPKGRQSW